MARLIKKYKNRRLYDTEKSKYITVEELTQYVVDGIIFHVEDSTTHEDITNATLLQIFVEMEANKNPFLSSEMLRQMIILAKHLLNELFKNSLSQFFELMEKGMKNSPYLSDLQNNSPWQRQMQNMFSQWQNLFKF